MSTITATPAVGWLFSGWSGSFDGTQATLKVRMREGLDATATPLSEVMTRAPHTIEPDRLFGHALAVMQEKGFRHLPVVQNGKPVGIVSSRSAMDPQLEEFVFEEHRRRHFELKR